VATQEDVRGLALALPGTVEAVARFAFSVMNKGTAKAYAWVWMERVEAKKARVANPSVLAVRVDGEEQKQFLIGAMPNLFFTEPHYNGFPAVLLRLERAGIEQLSGLLLDAWRIQAPRQLVAQFDASQE